MIRKVPWKGQTEGRSKKQFQTALVFITSTKRSILESFSFSQQEAKNIFAVKATPPVNCSASSNIAVRKKTKQQGVWFQGYRCDHRLRSKAKSDKVTQRTKHDTAQTQPPATEFGVGSFRIFFALHNRLQLSLILAIKGFLLQVNAKIGGHSTKERQAHSSKPKLAGGAIVALELRLKNIPIVRKKILGKRNLDRRAQDIATDARGFTKI
jgi:hypothetical protein